MMVMALQVPSRFASWAEFTSFVAVRLSIAGGVAICGYWWKGSECQRCGERSVPVKALQVSRR